MHKFEDIMGMSNYKAFCTLVSSATSDRLICYVGAGLSLYSKRWGEPFEMIVDDLIKYACDPNNPSDGIRMLKEHLNELYLLRYSLDLLRAKSRSDRELARQRLLNAYENVSDEDIEKYGKKKNYPKIGNIIEEILLSCKLHIDSPSGAPADTFNCLFCREIRGICDDKRENRVGTDLELPGRPYSFPSIYYLPYLKKCVRFITTNCDPSFDDVGEFLQGFDENINVNWISEHYASGKTDWTNELRAPGVFYIHGFYRNPDSLIMTQKSYNNVYNRRHSAIQFLQHDAAAHYTLLFLGASLEKDKTVDAINRQVQVQEKKPQFVIVSTSDKELRLHGGIKLYIPNNDYTDIPVVLHQLIRESCVNDNAPYSWKQNLSNEIGTQNGTIEDPEIEKTLLNFLNDDADFKEEEFEEQQRISILRFLHNRCLHQNGRMANRETQGSPNWTLCRIKDRRFTFDLSGPLHNYPLGNTIYILGGEACSSGGEPLMYNDEINQLSDTLHKWREETYPRYPSNEQFSEESSRLKVRVIRFPSELSSREELKYYGLLIELYAKQKCCTDLIVDLANSFGDNTTENADSLYSLSKNYPNFESVISSFTRFLLSHVLSTSKNNGQASDILQSVNEDTYEKTLRLMPAHRIRGDQQ